MRTYRETEVLQIARCCVVRGWDNGFDRGLARSPMTAGELVALEDSIIDQVRHEGALEKEGGE